MEDGEGEIPGEDAIKGRIWSNFNNYGRTFREKILKKEESKSWGKTERDFSKEGGRSKGAETLGNVTLLCHTLP